MQQNKQTQIDHKPGAQIVGLNQPLKALQHRLLQWLQDLCRRHELDLRTHDWGDGVGAVTADGWVEGLWVHAQCLVSNNAF